MTESLKFEFHKLLHVYYCSLISLDELKSVWGVECSPIYFSHRSNLDKALARWFRAGDSMLVDEVRAALIADGVADEKARKMADKLDTSIWHVIRSRESQLLAKSMN